MDVERVLWIGERERLIYLLQWLRVRARGLVDEKRRKLVGRAGSLWKLNHIRPKPNIGMDRRKSFRTLSSLANKTFTSCENEYKEQTNSKTIEGRGWHQRILLRNKQKQEKEEEKKKKEKT